MSEAAFVRIGLRCAARLCAGGVPGELELPAGTRVSDLLSRLGLSGVEFMILVDSGPAGPDTVLEDGAAIDILPIVDGG